jgi:outer membrane protein TolC
LGLPGAGAGEFEGGILTQEVVLGGKLKWSRKKYQARTEAAKCEASSQAWKVGNDVRVAFYHVLATREHVQIENELLKTMRDRWLTVNEMFNLGQANEADKHQANVGLEKQKLQVLAAQNNLQYTWQLLVTAVGIDIPQHEVSGNLDGEKNPIEWQSALQNVMDNSPELGEAKRKLDADIITVKREHRQPIPDVILSGGAGYDQLDAGFAAKANVNIVNIPLFDRNQGTIQQAEADLARQRAQVELVQLQLRRLLAQHFRVYTTALQHVQSYEKVILPEAQKRYEVMLQSYKDTRSDWPPVLEAQKDFFDLRNEYIDHQLALRESEIAIKGFVLTGALVAPPGVTPSGHIDATPKPR